MMRVITSLIIISLTCTLLTGCFDKKEIDEQTYVIAIGVDKGLTQPIRLTLQYAVPRAFGGGGSSGTSGSSQGSNTLSSVTIDAPTLNAGLNMANEFISKQVNVSHSIVIVFSQELAKQGISPYLYGIARMREFRPTMFVAVCKGSAEQYLNSISPIQEDDPSKYYQLVFTAYKYTGFTASTEFFKFYSDMGSLGENPIAVLAGISKYKASNEFTADKSTYKHKGSSKPFEGDYEAGDIPKVGDQRGEIMGLAVFNGDKMIGDIDGEQARDYLMVTGKFKQSYFTIPDPKMKDKYVVLNVKQSRQPSWKVDISGDRPVISGKIKLEADFVSIQSGIRYEDPSNMPIIENEAKAFINKGIQTFLEQITKNYNSDICGFGKQARKHFTTYKEWCEYQWLDKYKNSTFNIDMDFSIRRPGIIVESQSIKQAGGNDLSK